MCWAAGVTSSTPPKLSMASLYGEDVLRAAYPRMRTQLGVKRVASLDGGQLRRLAGRQIIGVDISAGGGYTVRRRFWREYLRMRFRREGGGADYLLFLHIQQVVQVRSAICVVPDQKRTAIDCVVVYGFFLRSVPERRIASRTDTSRSVHPCCASASHFPAISSMLRPAESCSLLTFKAFRSISAV